MGEEYEDHAAPFAHQPCTPFSRKYPSFPHLHTYHQLSRKLIRESRVRDLDDPVLWAGLERYERSKPIFRPVGLFTLTGTRTRTTTMAVLTPS